MKEKTRTRPWFQSAAAAAMLAILAGARVADAQHEGHGAPATPTPPGVAPGDCAARARESLRVLDAASRKIEEARQTNNPAKMRAAVEELQRDLGEIRSRLSASIPSPTPSVTGGTASRGDKPSPIP
jgi:hypothetical protein